MHLLTAGLPSPFVHLEVGRRPVLRRAADRMMHRHGGWVALRPGPLGSGSCCPGPSLLNRPRIRPTRRHIATPPHGGLYAMPSRRGSAEATREWFLGFRYHSVLTRRPPDLWEFDIASVQCRDGDAAFAEI